MNQVNSLLERRYRELELTEYPDELLQLEMLYLKITDKQRKEKEKESKWNRQI